MVLRTLTPVVTSRTTNVEPAQQTRQDVKFNKSFQFDFINNDIIVQDGNFVFVTEVNNLIQWMRKALSTEKGNHPIYNFGHGNELISMIGKGITVDVIEALFETMIADAIGRDNRITSIEKFSVVLENNNATITLQVNTINRDSFSFENSWVIA